MCLYAANKSIPIGCVLCFCEIRNLQLRKVMFVYLKQSKNKKEKQFKIVCFSSNAKMARQKKIVLIAQNLAQLMLNKSSVKVSKIEKFHNSRCNSM